MPFKNKFYERAVADKGQKISDKIIKAIEKLETQGYQEVPYITTNEIKKQFYIVCEMSSNGIALVDYTKDPVPRFIVRYLYNDPKIGKRVLTINNKMPDTMINVNPSSALFLFLMGKKNPINFVSPMWYKPGFFSSTLTPITDQIESIPIPAQTSNRIGGKKRKTRKRRFK
jgi:hypothetical protein